MSSATSSSTSNVVGVHYRVGKKIGEGSFGVLFEGTNLLTNQLVAIKFEPRKSEAPQLRDEYRTYKILVGCPGVPNVYYFGQEGLHNILVIDLLGPSLEDLFDHCNRRFSVKTSVLLAKQMISRVQTIHEKNMIYRDIKPDNFLMGRPGTRAANVVHVVDFGMAKQYRDPKTKQHMPYRERKALSGTARYMSINTHNGREQSRRDDLEALGHVFIYFLRGGLPWQGLKANSNKQKYDKIGEKKAQVAPKDLCEGLPDEFRKYLEYTRGLGFEETPDYDYCRSLMSKALADAGEVEDGEYDWLSHPKPGSARNAQRQGSGQKLREFKEVGNDRLMADLPTPKGKNDVYPPGPAKNINPPRRDTKARGPELQGSNAMRYPDATRKRYGQENEVDGSALATYGSATQGQSTMPTAYQPNSRNTQPGATQNETSQNMADMRESPTKKDSKFKKFINGMCCGMMD